MVAPIRFLSGRQQQQKIGVIGSTEDTKVLEVIGRVGIGTTIFDPTTNFEIRNNEGSIKIGELQDNQGSTDNGIVFVASTSGFSQGGITSYRAGLFTEVNGRILSYGINAIQLETERDTNFPGGIFRLDTRNAGGWADSDAFVIKRQPVGVATSQSDSGEVNGLVVKLTSGNTYTVPNGGTLLVGTASTISLTEGGPALPVEVGSDIKLQVGAGSTPQGAYISGSVGIGTTNPIADLDVVGLTELDNLNVSGIATVGTFGVSGLTTTNKLKVVGLSTFESNVDINASVDISNNLTVDGLSDLDELNVAGIATFRNNVEFFGSSSVQLTWDSVEDILKFKDDVAAYFGDGDDLRIFHNGSDSYISDGGVGNLNIISNGLGVSIKKSGTEPIANFNTDGSVELYYDNSKKFETTGYGVTVSGGLNVSGVSTFQNNVTFVGAFQTDSDLTWDKSNSRLSFEDEAQLSFGDNFDLFIYHTNGGTSLPATTTPGTYILAQHHDLIISAGNSRSVKISKSGPGTLALFDDVDGNVELYYQGGSGSGKKFETIGYGISVYGGINASGISTFQDEVYFKDNVNVINDKRITVGTGITNNCLRLYYDTSGTKPFNNEPYIEGLETNLNIQVGSGKTFRITHAGFIQGPLAQFTDDKGVELYYGAGGTNPSSKKFETTGVGVSIVNGTSDTATIYGPSNLIIDPMPVGVGTTSGIVRIKGDLYVDGTQFVVSSSTIELADFVVGIATTVPNDILLDGAGIGIGTNKTFLYEYNSGTNPSLKSSENLNVASGKVYQINQTERLSADTLSLGTGTTIHSPSSNELIFGTNGQERVRIDSSGNFGIGTNIPQTLLHVEKTTEGEIARFRAADAGRYLKISSFDSGFNGSGFDFDATSSAGEISFSTSGNEKVRIDNAGNLGIGTNAPTAKLDVRGTVNVTGVSTFTSAVDINAGLDVDGFTELDATNISETLNVVGLTTFGSNVDINASVDISTNLVVDGLSDLDELNVAGLSTFASNVDINADLDVDGRTELDITNISETLNVVGLSTFGSNVDINAGLDVDGHTELDTLNVSIATTTASLTLANAGVAVTAILDEDGLTSDRADALATQQSIKAYVDAQVTAQDLDIQGDTGGALSIDLDSEVLTIAGTASEIETSGSGNTITIGLPNQVAITTSLVVGSGVTITGSTVQVGGTITELYNGTFWNVVTQADVGYGASQVPLNQYLGQLAFLDDYHPNGLRRDGGGSDDVFVDSNGLVGINTTSPTSTLDVNGTLNVAGISTFASDIDINASIDVDGHTELDNLNVSGVSTFASNVDINAGLDVDGRTELDTTNISETLSVSGVSTFGSNVDINASVDIQNNLNVTGVSTFGGNVYLGDNDRLYFGDSNDLQIYHNGSDSLIRDTGTGDLYIDGGNVFIRSNLNENAISANSNGSVELYYDNNKKFETSGVGVTVYGDLYLQGGFSIGFNNDSSILTFNDGNNQTRAGYWTNKDGFIINGDGNNKSSVVLQTGNLEIDQNAYISGILGVGNTVYAATDIGIGTINPSEKLDVNGNARFRGKILDSTNSEGLTNYVLASNGSGGNVEWKAVTSVGAVSGIDITNDTTNTARYLTFATGTGNQSGLGITDSALVFNPSTTRFGIGIDNPTETLDVNGTIKTSQLNVTGVSTFGGNVYLGDNDSLYFGDGNDGYIFFDNNNLIITEVSATGSLLLRGQNLRLQDPGGTENYIECFTNGAVNLYYDNNKKLETTSDGVNITGTTDTDQLNVSGIATIATIDATNATIDNLTFTSGTAITSVDTDLSSVSATDNTLASAKAIKTYVDAQITAQDLDFAGDTGTGAVDLDSQTLTISGTANEIETSASGQALQIGLPNDVTIGQDLTVNRDVQINRNLNVDGNIAINQTTVVGSATSSLSTVTETAIHTGLSTSTYRSVEYNIQATQGTNFHVTKILALHNGTTAYHNEYGTIFNNTSVSTFNVDVSGGNIRLLATGASASQTDYVINFTATKI